MPRRFGRARTARRWTTQLVEGQTTAANTLTQTEIVGPADYRQADTLEPGDVTLVRLRGAITISRVTNVQFIWVWMCLVVADSDIGPTALNPNNAQNMIDEQVIWWDHMQILDTESSQGGLHQHREFDVKAKRRLHDESVWLMVSNSSISTSSIRWSLNARALLLGG